MAHMRRQIREAAAALLTGLASTGLRVYQSRVYPLRDSDMPCLLVSTDDESIQAEGIGAQQLERTLRLTVRAVTKATANLDDTLDQMLAEVEVVLNGNRLGGLSLNTVPESISIAMDDSLEKPAGVATLTYSITYFTAGSNPAAPL